jgi:hypothetical protein
MLRNYRHYRSIRSKESAKMSGFCTELADLQRYSKAPQYSFAPMPKDSLDRDKEGVRKRKEVGAILQAAKSREASLVQHGCVNDFDDCKESHMSQKVLRWFHLTSNVNKKFR